jgi:hypothetical protein
MATQQLYVDASPVKEFFVSMLTRDITLEDAILDLLDNCVDGILRNSNKLKSTKPYSGHRVDIDFNLNKFTITDNCGGIPESLFDYAFKMGSPKAMIDERPNGSLGSYGIGMKRAIFKMGRQCSILTRHSNKTFEFTIKKNWFDNERYQIPYESVRRRLDYDGTTIEIEDLDDTISKTFGSDKNKFETDLRGQIETKYGFIIGKGLKIRVNNAPIIPHITRFAFADGEKEVIKPYVFTAQEDGVSIFLIVGFIEPLVGDDEEPKYDPKHSGWSIVCNDRAIVYGDKTHRTHWGWGGVPMYHPQFNPIAGIVEFHSDDPRKLPTNTTKNNVDLDSELYVRVLDKMIEGVRPFIDYTNKWRGEDIKKGKKYIEEAPLYELGELKEKVAELTLSPVQKTIIGRQLTPKLPQIPKKEPEEIRISFKRKIGEVKKVSNYFFKQENKKASEIGERCFIEILKEIER